MIVVKLLFTFGKMEENRMEWFGKNYWRIIIIIMFLSSTTALLLDQIALAGVGFSLLVFADLQLLRYDLEEKNNVK